MTEVLFCSENEIADELLKFAVIITAYEKKYVFCRHKERATWEVTGGHIEDGESAEEAAKRELIEESGAVEFDITPVVVYGVRQNGVITFGKLFYADVKKLGKLSVDFEIAEIMLCDTMPEELTYPEIQPVLWEKVRKEMRID